MKKLIIGSLVGAIILFVWNFLSWVVLPIHLHTVNYTPAQDSILKLLAESGMEDGAYAMPMADNRNAGAFDAAYQDARTKVMEKSKGKPMASVYYLKDGYNENIPRGFLLGFLSVFAACILLVPAFTTV